MDTRCKGTWLETRGCAISECERYNLLFVPNTVKLIQSTDDFLEGCPPHPCYSKYLGLKITVLFHEIIFHQCGLLDRYEFKM